MQHSNIGYSLTHVVGTMDISHEGNFESYPSMVDSYLHGTSDIIHGIKGFKVITGGRTCVINYMYPCNKVVHKIQDKIELVEI